MGRGLMCFQKGWSNPSVSSTPLQRQRVSQAGSVLCVYRCSKQALAPPALAPTGDVLATPAQEPALVALNKATGPPRSQTGPAHVGGCPEGGKGDCWPQ